VNQSKSSRQLCCHILPVADMEATSYIRYLLASGAVRNVNLNNCPRANAILCHSMCRDERRLPLDARSTLGAVSLVVPIVKAGGHQEQRFFRGKRINADVMRCLQFALTFHMPICHKTCKACGGRATLVGRKYTEHASHWRTLIGRTEGKSAPTRQVKRRVTPKQPYRCSQLNT